MSLSVGVQCREAELVNHVQRLEEQMQKQAIATEAANKAVAETDSKTLGKEVIFIQKTLVKFCVLCGPLI